MRVFLLLNVIGNYDGHVCVSVCVCVCVPKQNKFTLSCYWIPLLETLTAIALGGARKSSQILCHSKMDNINAALKIIPINRLENQVLGSTGLTLAWVLLVQVKETYLCSGVALKDLQRNKGKGTASGIMQKSFNSIMLTVRLSRNHW